jgi:hypothetical protein
MEVIGQHHAPAALAPRTNPQYMLASPGAGMVWRRKKSSASTAIRPPDLPARCTACYFPRCEIKYHIAFKQEAKFRF